MDGTQSLNADTVLKDPILTSKFLDPGYLFDHMVSFFRSLYEIIFSSGTGSFLHGLFYFWAIFFLSLIGYTIVRLFEIRAKERKHLHHELEEYAHHQAQKEKKVREGEGVSKNPRWVKILEYLSSSNVNDWKLAVIEADSMLDSLVGDLGFKGENLGEKLKMADRDKFRSLSSAWEVHIIRNRIAHEGEAFNLSLHEAKRVIALYEQIFREFGYI